MRIFHALGMAFCLIAMNVPAGAQWVNYPDPRTPRTADGKPNLTAPAPRLADQRLAEWALSPKQRDGFRWSPHASEDHSTARSDRAAL